MNDKKIIIHNKCMHCGYASLIEIFERDYQRWKNGELIQIVWPESTAAWREMLKTGIHPSCWDEMFSGEED